MTHPDPKIWWMNAAHTWCSKCGDYYGTELYEKEHAHHD